MVGGAALAGAILVASGGIQVSALDGTHVQAITRGHDDQHPAWSRDGRTIAFVRAERTLLVAREGAVRRVAVAPPRHLIESPVLAPDGRRIAFGEDAASCTNPRPQDSRLHIGARSFPITPTVRGKAVYVYPQSWSTRNRIAFLTETWPSPVCTFLDTSPTYRLFVVDATGQHQRLVATGLGIGDARWSPDGSRLAYLSEQGGCRIVVDGHVVGRVNGVVRPCGPVDYTTEYGPAYAWSPDSTTIYYGDGAKIRAANVVERTNTVRARSPATTAECRTPYSCDRFVRAVSPDGSTLLMQDVPEEYGDSLPLVLYAVATDGSGVTRLPYPRNAEGAAVLWRLTAP